MGMGADDEVAPVIPLHSDEEEFELLETAVLDAVGARRRGRRRRRRERGFRGGPACWWHLHRPLCLDRTRGAV